MRTITCIVFLLVAVGTLAVSIDADGGWIFNRKQRQCDTKGNCDPDLEAFPVDEIEQYRIDSLTDPVDESPLPVEPSAELVARIDRLEQLIADAGFTVIFEGGDESDETSTTVRMMLGGTLVIPPQVLRIRTVDRHGHSIGEPLVDVAPLGSPLKVRNVIR